MIDMLGLVESRIGRSGGADPYGGWSIDNISDLVMLRDLINTGSCTYQGATVTTYKGNSIDIKGYGCTWYVTANIDMSSVCGSGIGSWTPIGSSSSVGFRGIIQGQNYTISNLYIDASTVDNKGVFGYCYAASFYDLNLTNVNVTGNDYCGGLVGYQSYSSSSRISYDWEIDNITVSGTITGTGTKIGGIVGYAYVNYYSTTGAGSGSINNCINYATVTATSDYSGGIVGQFQSANYSIATMFNGIDLCENYGAISGKNYVGGIAGYHYASGKLENCINEANITGTSSRIGGITGKAYNSTYTVEVNYCESNTGYTITGLEYVGGILGDASNSSVSNCVNYSAITITTGNYLGGIVGYGSTATVSYCTNQGSINKTGTGYGYIGGIMGYPNNYCEISNCTNNGNIVDSVSTAVYAGGIVGCLYTNVNGVLIDSCVNNGDITLDQVAQTRAHGILGYCNTSYNVWATITDCTNNGDITGYYASGIADSFKVESTVTGCLNYGAITGKSNVYGIFGSCSSITSTISGNHNHGTVTTTLVTGQVFGICYGYSNLPITNCTNNNTVSGGARSCGIAYYGIFNNCHNYSTLGSSGQVYGIASTGTATNCTNSGQIISTGAAVGIIGTGNASSCTNTGNITAGSGYTAGILLSLTAGLTLTNSINTGTIQGSSLTCGICQSMAAGATISFCTNTGSVVGTSAAGICCSTSGTGCTITKCVNEGAISGTGSECGGILRTSAYGSTISFCWNKASVTSTRYCVGGIVGQPNSSTSYSATITCCRNDGNVSGEYSVGGITAYMYQDRYVNCNTCINTGTITRTGTGSTYYIGGVVGNYSSTNNTLANNYYDNSVETNCLAIGTVYALVGSDISGEAEGLSTANLQGTSLEGTGSWTSANWTFASGEYPEPNLS